MKTGSGSNAGKNTGSESATLKTSSYHYINKCLWATRDERRQCWILLNVPAAPPSKAPNARARVRRSIQSKIVIHKSWPTTKQARFLNPRKDKQKNRIYTIELNL